MSKQKTVLFYSPFSLWSPHLETELEIAYAHLKEDARIIFFYCQGVLSTCEQNYEHELITCKMCESKLHNGVKLLQNFGAVESYPFKNLTAQELQIVQAFEKRTFTSLEELRSVTIDGSDIGSSAISSAIIMLREPSPDIVKDQALLKKNLISALIVHYSMSRHLKKIMPDILYLFNGRVAGIRPALRAAQALGIETFVHERAGYLNRYALTHNTYPHELAAQKKEVSELFENSPLDFQKKYEIGSSWFEERLNNQVQAWEPFTKQQQEGLLPETFKSDKLNVVLFLSTDEELAELPDWKFPFFDTQTDGVRKTLEFLRKQKLDNIRLTVREHTNMRGVTNSHSIRLSAIAKEFPELTLVEAHSKISTYALIKECNLVVSFGSTTAIEGVYIRKPSIILGRCPFEHLGAFFVPQTQSEYFDLLSKFSSQGSLPASENRDKAIAYYGFYMKSRGIPFQHVKPSGVFGNSEFVVGETRKILRPSIHWRLLSKAQEKVRSVFRKFF